MERRDDRNATGFGDGVSPYSSSFLVVTVKPLMQTFNWTNLSSVTFSASGDVHHEGYGGVGTSIATDDLTVDVTASVQEPLTCQMLILGIGVARYALRRSKEERVRLA